jgi:hypothetical protein
MTSNFQSTAAVNCFVDIYTKEQGVYNFSGQKLLRVKTSKTLKGNVGIFEIHLAPETIGPNLSWSQIITPMSLVVIGMKRADKAAIPMVGVVSTISESQVWTSGASVDRTIVIRGYDFSYFFTITDYYTLWYLTVVKQLGISLSAAGLLQGDPGQIAQTWYDSIMAGVGVYGATSFPYKSANLTFTSVLGQRFDNYDVQVPFGDYFLGGNESWLSKFRETLPMPFYEFFITTMSNAAYSGVSGGTQFSSQGLGSSITATPVVIGRLNPVPLLTGSSPNNDAPPIFPAIDTSKWVTLPLFELDSFGFIGSSIAFSEHDVHNFYVINPTWLSGQNGQSNSNITQFIFNYALVVDDASLNRYGYRPMMGDISWLSDIEGGFAQNSKTNVPQLMATLLGRFCGYYEPLPLMASAVVTTWLRPDIQIGCRFRYKPFKDNVSWDFYVEGVDHIYTFGNESTTILTLSRGLPTSVYNDSTSNGLLYNLHIGNAQRKDSVYEIGLPSGSAQPLHALNATQTAVWMGQLSQHYITPQSVKQ